VLKGELLGLPQLAEFHPSPAGENGTKGKFRLFQVRNGRDG
jgi:hypothetical protein